MRLLLSLEVVQLSASPSRLLVMVLAPLLPLLLRLLGLLEEGLVFPAFVLAYQLLAMCLSPWGLVGVRGGWKLAWLTGAPGPLYQAAAAYLGILSAYAAAPVAAYLALTLVVLGEAILPSKALFLASIGVLHQALGLLALSQLGSQQRGWAALLTYQAVLLVFAAALLREGWTEAHAVLSPIFPSLAALSQGLGDAMSYPTSALTLGVSALLLYIFAHGLATPRRIL